MTDRVGFYKVSPRTIRVWRISNAISYFFYFGIPAVYYAILGADGFHGWFLAFLIFAILIVWSVAVFWFPYQNWRNWRYTITQHEIELKYGIFFKTHTLIPLSRYRMLPLKFRHLLQQVWHRWISFCAICRQVCCPAPQSGG